MSAGQKDIEQCCRTKAGKPIIGLSVSLEFAKEIAQRAESMHLTRQAYLITLINADLKKAKEEELDELRKLQERV